MNHLNHVMLVPPLEGGILAPHPRRKSLSITSGATGAEKSAAAAGKFRLYSLDEVSNHTSPQDCWIVLYDRVYDVTNFLPDHPGGRFILTQHAGQDATSAFRSSGHDTLSPMTQEMLAKCCIGMLIPQERMYILGA